MRQIYCFGVLLLLVMFTGCATVGHHEAGIENFDQVSATLYRGAQPTAEGFRTLARMQVRTVINLRDSGDAVEARQVQEAGMAYVHMPLNAETVTVADAERFLATLSTASKPVFVHCMVGRDRTGLAVAAYRVCVENWSEQAAVKELIDHGHFWVLFPKVRAAVGVLARRQDVVPKVPAVAEIPAARGLATN